MLLREVPQDLIGAVIAREIVPIIGDGLNIGMPDGPATPEQMLSAIASQLGSHQAKASMRDLPILASEYEAKRGLHALTDLARTLLGQNSPRTTPELNLAVKIAHDAIITTSVSHSAQQALSATGSTEYSIVTDPIGASYVTLSRRPWLIKLAGCVSRPESLVISQDRLMWLSTSLDKLGILIRGLLLTRTLVFIGYSLDDPYLEALHVLLQMSDDHSRKRYIILPSSGDVGSLDAIWSKRGYDVIVGPTIELLTELAGYAYPQGRSLRPVAPAAIATPFKFLDYFTEHEQHIFFARAHEADILSAIVATSPFSLITGPSGVGKTSLINAGLVPRLHSQGIDTYVVRALEHPTDEIISAISLTAPASAASVELFETLRTRLNDKPTAIIIDQFEEFFIRIGPESRTEFAQQLNRCMKSETLNVRFVVVMREDFLHRLLELEPPIEHIFKNRYWVRPFTRPQTIEFFSDTSEKFRIQIDPTLVSLLIEDLDHDGIDPSQLQIVGNALHQFSSQGTDGLTCDSYKRLGKTQGILSRYLDHVLDDLTPDHHPIARGILKCMVSADQTKAVMSAREIASDTITKRLGISEEAVHRTIEELVRRRIVRPIPGRLDVFELAHDVMVKKIWEWIEPEEIELKYARQTLQQAVVDWGKLASLPGTTQWAMFQRHRDELSLTPQEALLLLNAAVQRDSDLAWWVERASRSSVDTGSELQRILENEHPDARLAIVLWLRTTDHKRRGALLEAALSSAYPSIRRAARRIVSAIPGYNSFQADMFAEGGFVAIEASDFMFGTDDARFEYSQPAHNVHVSGFALQRYPVTNAEYLLFVQDTGQVAPTHWGGDEPAEKLLDHPVVQVSWFDAQAYCAWYSQRTGLATRLPTAAEWEKAAGWRPDTREKYLWSWGNEYDSAKGNSRMGGPGHTTPIGQYSPAGGDSWYGASDMCGNTFDWVQDWWMPSHDMTQTRDPKGAREGEHKCARGGSWAGSSEGTSAVSNKYSLAPETHNEYVGFRLAYSIDLFQDWIGLKWEETWRRT